MQRSEIRDELNAAPNFPGLRKLHPGYKNITCNITLCDRQPLDSLLPKSATFHPGQGERLPVINPADK